MATIIDTSSISRDKMSWVGQVQWPTDIDPIHVEPNASLVGATLAEKGYQVQYYHVSGVEPEQQTNYTLTGTSEVTYPEAAEEDWRAAVEESQGAKSNYFEYNHPVNPPEQ